MTAVTFDTLKFLETLKAAGFDEAQAKGIVTIMREAQDSRMDELASKRDLKELELKLENRLSEAKVEIIKWVVGASGVVVAAIKLFPGVH